MPLDIVTLKSDIKSLSQKLLKFDGSEGQTQDDALEVFTTDLTAAIDKFVKTGTVTLNPLGLTVAAAPGPVVGTATGTIS